MSPQVQGPREAPEALVAPCGPSPSLCQGCGMPGLLSLHDAPHEALVRGSCVRQAVRHANVAVGWTFAAPHSRGPEALQGGDWIEPWYVDVDAQPTILAWMGSHSW